MSGTILITGANGSLAIPAVAHLLTTYPTYTAILTVRNASSTDANTTLLRETISQFPTSKTAILELDLSSLSAVQSFTTTLSKDIANGTYPPLVAIICNAFWWNLAVPEPILTPDGYEKSFQVNHLAHASLVLRLLPHSFDKESGARIVTLSSDAHWPGKNGLQEIPPSIPENVDELVKPAQEATYKGRPFQRYANSKLAIVMWTHALNRRLANHPTLNKITAVACDPGSLVDSRALRTNTTNFHWYLQKLILKPLKPLLAYMNPLLRNAAEASPDLIDLAMRQVYPDEGGHFQLAVKDQSSPDSLDEGKQDLVWKKTLEWVGLTREDVGGLG